MATGNSKLQSTVPQASLERTSVKLSDVGKLEMSEVLTQANISRPSNFQLLSPDEWVWIMDRIQENRKYKELTLEELDMVIKNGTIGRYNKTQFAVNAFTIFSWLNKYISDKKENEIYARVMQ